jgi:hypothetical protein
MATTADVDKELSQMLDASGDDSQPVEAVFRLRPEAGQVLIDPGVAEQTTKQVLERAEQTSGQRAHDYNVFRNLGSFMVSAPASLIRAIIQQPEIGGALANRQRGGAKIEPVAKRPAELPKARPTRTRAKKSTSEGARKK